MSRRSMLHDMPVNSPEAAFLDTNDSFRASFEQSVTGIAVTRPDGRILTGAIGVERSDDGVNFAEIASQWLACGWDDGGLNSPCP